MYGDIAKRVEQVIDPDRIPEVVSRAFHTAVNGRAGPVVVALPEDMLREQTSAEPLAPFHSLEPAPTTSAMDRFAEMLRQASRPVMIVGGRGWTARTRECLQQFAADWQLPVVAGFRFQDCFDNGHEQYVGGLGLGTDPDLTAAIKASDLVIAVGVRLGEVTTAGYSLIDIPQPRQPLVHVYPGMEELGSVYYPALAMNASTDQFAAALGAFSPAPVERPWSKSTRDLRQGYLDWTQPLPGRADVNLSEVVCTLRDALPADAIIANGAGNYTAWVHRFHRYRELGSQLAPTAGSMGYGLPAAVTAKLLYPKRTVVVFAGDGCFLMTGQELATAVQYRLAIVIIVVNNNMLGTIRMHQEQRFPGRVIGTELVNPDFCALARAYGAHAERVEKTEEFLPALNRALAEPLPALIELTHDPDTISPTRSLAGM